MNTTNSKLSRGAIWAWVPAALLGSMLLGLGTLAYLALDDPHFALEPNYYDKAVHWDRSQREARDSAALGLQLALPQALFTLADGALEIEIKVTDRAGSPLEAARAELEAFPNAYASRVQRITLNEVSPGVYRGRLIGRDLGLWELRFSITQGNLRFRQSVRRDVTAKEAA
jgi:nitrogen fixation protein FixH